MTANLLFDEAISDKELKSINRFWIGFIIYTLGFTLSMSQKVPFAFCQVLQSIGLFLIILASVKLIRLNIDNKYLKIVYPVYCLWLLITIMRGFNLNYGFLKEMLFNAWASIFLYFVPLLFLFHKSIIFYKKAFNSIIMLGIACLILYVLFIRSLLDPDITNLDSQSIIEYFSKTIAIPCGFILLTYLYQSKKYKLIALAVMLLTFLLGIIRARRGIMFMTICPLIFAYFIYLFANKGHSLKWLFSFLLAALIIVYGFKVYNENKNGFFSAITERADEDTRTGVEEYFYADMEPKDWLIGRGVDGKYYCPGIDDFQSLYRTAIETDYLQLILKGGIISLGLLLLIAVPAMLKGFFLSKNILSKAAAIWILLWIIDLYPATVTTFTLNYILVWISIGICYSDEIRNIPENKMIEYFQSSGSGDEYIPDK